MYKFPGLLELLHRDHGPSEANHWHHHPSSPPDKFESEGEDECRGDGGASDKRQTQRLVKPGHCRAGRRRRGTREDQLFALGHDVMKESWKVEVAYFGSRRDELRKFRKQA